MSAAALTALALGGGPGILPAQSSPAPTGVTMTTTVVTRSPLIVPLALVAIIVVAAAGLWIYSVIRKGL